MSEGGRSFYIQVSERERKRKRVQQEEEKCKLNIDDAGNQKEKGETKRKHCFESSLRISDIVMGQVQYGATPICCYFLCTISFFT